MIDVEKVISRHRDRVHAEYDRTQRQKLPYLHRQVMRRFRRRRLVKRVGITSCAVAVVACLLMMSSVLPPASGSIGGGTTLASGGSVAVDPSSEIGFWPYVRKDLSEHVCSSSVLHGPRNAAVGFAESMLGWTNVVVIGTNRYGNHAAATIGEIPTTFTGGFLPPHPVIKLHLERLRSENCWWITGISDPDDAASFSATVEDGELHVSFDPLPGAERADVVVVEEGNNLRRHLDVDAEDRTAHLTGFRGPGAVIVLWKGTSGVVFSAAGVTLPGGDSSRETF
jgi:hypothetical protein